MNKKYCNSFLFLFLLVVIGCKVTKSQTYDANFSKPIITEKGQYVYNELPGIKTTEGVLFFLDRNLGATSTDVSTSDSWGDLYQWGRATDGHEKRYSDTTLTLSHIGEVHHNRFIVDERKSNDWLTWSDNDLWNEKGGVNNPCPCGYRLPTSKEWKALLDLGYEVKKSTSGYYYLSIDNGKLLLPSGGLRSAWTGNFQHMGTRGYYWAADAKSKGTSSCIDFNRDDITTNISIFGFRCFGRSVRCMRGE
jgi:Fibrobacter succinogenes major domain (Fib_succ_major).